MPLSRTAMFSSSLGSDVALLSMTGRETMGRPFSFEVDLLSENDSLDLKEILAKPASVVLERLDGTVREFNGLVTEFALVGEHGKFARYRCVLRPALWFIGQNRKCRIFQDKSVPEIVTDLLRERGITDFENLISETHRKWEFLVQYRESDLNFIHRILEQEGIYYFFKHEDGKHVMVLLDSSATHEPADGFEEVPFFAPLERGLRLEEHVDAWFTKRQIRPDKVKLVDFNFETPKPFYTEGASAPLDNDHGDAEVYDYPAEAVDKDQAEIQATRRLEELQADHEIGTGSGPVRGLYAGVKFKLKQFPRDDQNKDYVIISASYEISTAQFESNVVETDQPTFRFSFTALDAKQQYRSPCITRKPVVEGPQTALVVGPKENEIFTDPHGRVKLKFHWDPDPKSDASSSCFVRVAQVWAGEGWGSMHIPRIGQEVIVSFLEGDPDRPIITGRVYNGHNHPPYTLGDNKTQSGIKTRSTPGGSPDNFNEIRFEDKKGEEELHIQAEKDLSTLVKHDRTTTILHNDTLNIQGDQFIHIHGNLSMTVDGVTDDKNPNKGKPIKSSMAVTGAHDMKATDSVTISAPTKITLSVPGSTITLTPGGITISAGGGASVSLDSKIMAAAAGKATVSITDQVSAKSAAGSELTLGPRAYLKGSAGGDVWVDANFLATAKGGGSVLADSGTVTLKATKVLANGTAEASLNVGGASVKASTSGVDVNAATTNVSGTGLVKIAAPLVKIN
jgi:type VI secretion system secreted protein VgrG